ncbi:hypothetical protein, partial [Acinetobacter baumannii]|uniref:hypothetical protein n=1 Tax=Acinetobacter baumannii TaxID=470 RepID=UPI0011129444
GVGLLIGSFDWINAPRLQLNLKGANLLVRQAPLITAIANPILTLDLYPFDMRLSLKGSVDVPRARISMSESPAPVVHTSSFVRIVSLGQDPLAFLRA